MLLYHYHLTHNLKVAGSNPAPATNLPYVVDYRVRRVLGVFSNSEYTEQGQKCL